ncbi:MAG: glycogen debranching enzyme GlgX [Gammaproteobacteria bacterium]|nr:MAG: glycogen debranching enzyme GlgX [Gammaproteobacteria bacterium]
MNKTKKTSANKPYQISAGRSYPLGATVENNGVNFALFSANASKVELCLFDASGKNEIARLTLPEFTDEVWHGYVEGLPAGSLYGYRVHGAFDPHQGHRFNAHKLLLDPYAKQLFGDFVYSDTHYGYDQYNDQHDLTFDTRDNSTYLPKCVIVDELENCQTHPQIRRRDTLIYELHVKGFTQNAPDVPIELQGTFAGLASDNVCEYIQALGITSIELMPIHCFLDEPFLQEQGLSNYWGYNSLCFFVPEAKYCLKDGINEFKALVEKYHRVGIEIILDVVYNHTAEGDHLGPTICYKGIDNASYYILNQQDKRFYINNSGCGNSLNIDHPRVLQLVTDSLRYWVEKMGVDGFRFDLAPSLARDQKGFNKLSHFFTVLRQDPVLSTVKLIAEPWDIGENGYQLGHFPNSWLEWNDKFRDTCRRFWRGDQGMAPEFAQRLHGSSDLFENPSRRPSSSVNFISSHDGFTLHDLVTYQEKHNQANGEQNQDGHNANFSDNFGIEGESQNTTINQLRLRQKRNLLTSLFIAQGTPMLLAGDEFGHSQQGNNNAYCQNNELSWLNWQQANLTNNQALLSFVKHLIALRKAHPLLNRTHYHHGKEHSDKTGLADINWLNCHGERMQQHDWQDSAIKCFAMLLAQTTNDDTDKANKINKTSANEHCDDALLVIFNAHPCEINYRLPQELCRKLTGNWQLLINTAEQYNGKQKHLFQPKNITTTNICIAADSCVLLAYKESANACTSNTNLPIDTLIDNQVNKENNNHGSN